MTLEKKHFENVGLGENAGNQPFLLFLQCFLPIRKTIQCIITLILLPPIACYNLDKTKKILFD